MLTAESDSTVKTTYMAGWKHLETPKFSPDMSNTVSKKVLFIMRSCGYKDLYIGECKELLGKLKLATGN